MGFCGNEIENVLEKKEEKEISISVLEEAPTSEKKVCEKCTESVWASYSKEQPQTQKQNKTRKGCVADP